MNTFVNAVKNQEARTENGMKARLDTSNPVTDLFYKIGASRGKNIVPDFVSALVADETLAVRIALWARDARGGAGEREIFRQILKYLESNRPDLAEKIVNKVPELGRWDDLLEFETDTLKEKSFDLIKDAINSKNGLCAKWMPRKGKLAAEIRSHLGLSPKGYRKTLVSLTNVVETQMCAKEWDGINFSHVPSVASARYKKAFWRNAAEKYAEYVASLVKGDNPKVKVNAGAIFPYDVLKGVISAYGYNRNSYNKTQMDLVMKQWEALPNYVGDASILPLVDVSGSMVHSLGDNLTCLDVAVSLGLYLAEKNSGVFKDTFLTFSSTPELLHLNGNIVQKAQQMCVSEWGMSTNLHAAFDKILSTAVKGNATQEDMPQTLLILSDMQFDACAKFDDSAYEMISRKYEKAGYKTPNIVFWNLNSKKNSPAKFNQKGVALVSGFSPAIARAVLNIDAEEFSPENIMMKAIMNPRYDF